MIASDFAGTALLAPPDSNVKIHKNATPTWSLRAPQANQTPQRHDRPTVAVADPHRPSALRTGDMDRNQDLLVRRLQLQNTFYI